jgi:hypothetical protein
MCRRGQNSDHVLVEQWILGQSALDARRIGPGHLRRGLGKAG